MKLRFYTLWAINAWLDERELCRQLDLMRAHGFDGAVFHPRFYPNEPPYLSDDYLAILSQVILHAQAIGLGFWIYDENGWPSGTAGGELLKQFPADAQQWADLVTEEPADCLASFVQAGRRYFIARRRGAGVDYFSPQLAQHFIQLTHERYRQGLKPGAFAHVEAFFCDEPEFGLGHAYDSLSPQGAIPWTPRLPEIFLARHGEKLEPLLPLLFFSGKGAEEVRVKFWELLTDLFNESFIVPLDQWCHQHGKRFTAHVKGEEHPLFQVPTSGSCHQVFQHLALPGIDALERYPSGHFFPRQVASVAQQFGNGECMVECFGGAGWGASPEDFENYLNWLAGHGLTHFVTHLWQYQLTTHAIQDWPPSQPVHVNWRDVYPLILDRMRKKFSTPRPAAGTLVIAPYRGLMEQYIPRELRQTNIHNAATYPDTAAGRLNTAFLQLLDRVHASGVDYHVNDERTVEEHGNVKDGVLGVGRCEYQNVVLAEGVKLNSELRRSLAALERKFSSLNEHWVAVSETPAGTSIPVAWKIQAGTINDLVLEAEAVSPSHFVARFDSTAVLEVELVLVDEVREVAANGQRLGDDRKFRCRVGQNEIRLVGLAGGAIPFLALRGLFAVQSRSPFITGPNEVMATEGAFFLEAFKLGEADHLLASGFPFCREAVIVHGEMNLPQAADQLAFPEIHADCVRVTVDGVDCGWCWGADWKVRLAKAIPAGRHRIEVRLIPSTFNFFGPHHHVHGDRPIVSPVQFLYVRNFADRPEAPANTRVNRWHFKPFGIGATITT